VTGLLRAASYPLLLGGGMAIAWLALAGGASPVAVVLVVPVVTAAIAICLEWIIPFDRRWLRSHGDLVSDGLHFAVSNLAIGSIPALGNALWIWIATSIGGALGGSPWPDGWPLAAQLLLAILLVQLVDYGLHRALHRVPLLWRLHAVHHGAERVYWLNTFRTHPIEALFYVASMLVPVLAGAPVAVIALLAVFHGIAGVLQHANLDLRLGPLGLLFNASEQHRWHHSTSRDEAEANYGSILLVWDWLFGTGRAWRAGTRPRAVGVEGHAPVRGYLAQLRQPFVRSFDQAAPGQPARRSGQA
jgi:sterol desaturase/sphingolipid hydroxylase (fatty acid hydroxylase superfamily)